MLHRRVNSAVSNGDRPVRNPYVVLREEFDDWAVLFNPDTGRGFGLSPTGVYVWKLLDRGHTIDEMLTALRRDALDVPGTTTDDVGAFVDALVAEGLAGFQSTECGPRVDAQRSVPDLEKCSSPVGGQNEAKPFTYDPPKLIDFTGGPAARGDCYDHGSHGGSCQGGGGATDCCDSGTCPSTTRYNCTCFGYCVAETNCYGGTSVVYHCSSGDVACNVCTTGGNLH